MPVEKKRKRSHKGDKKKFKPRISMRGQKPKSQADLEKTGADVQYAARRKAARPAEVEAKDAGTKTETRVARWPTTDPVPSDFDVETAEPRELIKYGFALEPPPAEYEIMTEVGVKKWIEVTELLLEMRVLKQIDCLAISRYCIHFQDWIRCTKEINELGSTICIHDDAGKIVSAIKNPAHLERNKAENHMKKLEDHYGFTPASRVIIGGQQARGMGKHTSGPEPIPIPDPKKPAVTDSTSFFEKHGS